MEKPRPRSTGLLRLHGEPVTAGDTVTIKLNNYWLGTFLGAWLRPGALSMPLEARSDHVGDAT